jgi:hypothetical protein
MSAPTVFMNMTVKPILLTAATNHNLNLSSKYIAKLSPCVLVSPSRRMTDRR